MTEGERSPAGSGRGANSVVSALVLTVLLAVGVAGCGEEPVVEDFTAANQDAFLTACARPIDDPRLLSDVCRCVFDRAEDELGYERFNAIDAELRADPTAELPEDVVDILTDCFIDESGLADG